MFGDLVGFTSLSESLDPELVKNLVDQAFERLAADIVRFGGRVDKVMGDGLLALFGAPVMHEDDAERAVRAALAMQLSMAQLRAEREVDIHMRIGVNTGEVLVGEIHADGDYTAMGDVVNTANRLQAEAQPDTVLVGPGTHDVTATVIRYEPHGSIVAQGATAESRPGERSKPSASPDSATGPRRRSSAATSSSTWSIGRWTPR